MPPGSQLEPSAVSLGYLGWRAADDSSDSDDEDGVAPAEEDAPTAAAGAATAHGGIAEVPPLPELDISDTEKAEQVRCREGGGRGYSRAMAPGVLTVSQGPVKTALHGTRKSTSRITPAGACNAGC